MKLPTALATCVVFSCSTSAYAHAVKFDKCVRTLCTSTNQMDCWVKMGSPVCDQKQMSCTDLPDHAGAKILGKSKTRWHVKTKFGEGWVSTSAMMIDSIKCNTD